MIPKGNIVAATLVGLIVAGITGFILLVVAISWFSNAPFGLNDAPAQPIAFPHTAHAGTVEDGGLGMECEFCHRNVTKGDSATVPALQQCWYCHQKVSGGDETAQAEIDKLVTAYSDGVPVNWERVHRLPDHVRFVHEAHIRHFTQGETPETQLEVKEVCTVCHGEVAKMEEVQPKQFQSLKMGTCLDCHRKYDVPTDCTICHK